ncbi:MAG: sigma-70 family RNA polymerase sigma factor [Acidobacteria bacterium]|nr:sigma-70 family RNA polymerase sigma factor [Acidobacteriota bacterium]
MRSEASIAATEEPDLEQEAASSITVASGDLSVSLSSPPSEAEALVARAKAGDREAFAALYRQYLPNVYKFLYYRLGNRTRTEDMTAEVFLRALRKIGDFTWTGADFGAWLLRIARNLILDEAKSSRARLEILDDELPEEAGEVETAETAVMENLTQAEVYKAITKLRPDQRDVITLRFLQGLGVSEVAAIMGKKEGTVRTLQFRGLKTLEKILVSRAVLEGLVSGVSPRGVRTPTNGRGKGRTEPEAARYGYVDGER